MTPIRKTCLSGFTLVELMISVVLLAMLFIVAGFIYDSSMTVISKVQGNNEMVMSLDAFDRVMRSDLRSIEGNGFLILGRRQQDAYATGRDASQGIQQSFRNDWMIFYTATERHSSLDPRVIGQCQRVLWGHGQGTDPSNPNGKFTNRAVNWVLMRHQIVLVTKLKFNKTQVQPNYTGWADPVGPTLGIEWPDMGDYPGMERLYTRMTESYGFRQFHWWWYWNYAYKGPVSTPWAYNRGNESISVAFDEPTFYLGYSAGLSGSSLAYFTALPHCGQFQVQYAMAEDLGHVVAWRDPPQVTDAANSAGNPQDPNYNPSDPIYTVGTVVGGQGYCPRGRYNQDGRLVFGPGDRWPILLKVTVHVYDPLNRLENGRELTVVARVP